MANYLKALEKTTVIKMAVLFIIFALFLFNATGLLEISWQKGVGLSINSKLFGGSGISFRHIIKSYEFYSLIFVGILLSFLLPLIKPITASLLTFFCMLPAFLISYFIPNPHALVPMEYSFLMILVLFVINVLISYFLEVHNKQAMIDMFGHYIPPELASQISKNPDSVNLSGEARKMTVFFSDLQNFTSASEQLNPKQLTLLLNEYFNAMTEVLYKHGGTIDKYIGDSIMAFWNAPLYQEDHARRSMLAAMEMQAKVDEISDSFKNRGWPAPQMSIGINTGVMNVGNMGSKYRVAYTVVGDAVNLASRIEHLTRIYKVGTIISEGTMKETNDIIYRELDTVQVRGKKNKTRIYEPICHKDQTNQLIEKKLTKHQIALNQYYKENWLEAMQRFNALRKEYGDEYYLAMVAIVKKKMR